MEVNAGRSRVLVRFVISVEAILTIVQVNRLLRVRVIAVTLLALLFAQFSVAAYACPSTAKPAAEVMTGMDCEGMVSQLDPASPNLCAEHCQYGSQTDQLRTPPALGVALVSLYVVPLTPALIEPSQRAIASSGLLTARAPPHTILHCCFRI